MKKLLLATVATAALGAGAASAEDVKIGLSLGYTGPLESMAPAMTQGAELAIKEVNDSGKFMGGSNVTSVAEQVVMSILLLVRNFVPAHEVRPPFPPCPAPAH